MLALANPPGEFGPADLSAAQKLARVYAMILQRKAAEDRQREEDSRFRAIISSSKDIIYSVDLAGKITYISPRAMDYGYRQEDLVGHAVTDFAHPDDKEFLSKAFALAVRTGRTLPILPYRIKRKDGSYFYAEQKSGIVFNSGKPAYFTGVIRDVTEQKATEARLKESEALMSTVFDTADDAIFLKDMNGMYVKVNKAFADLFKLTPEELLGKGDPDIFAPELAAGIFKEDSEVVRTGKTLSFTRRRLLPAGDFYFNTVKTPMRNIWGEIIGVLGISRDISGIKKMETELALAHAAEAVSSVARPMAHDFNNALAAINGYATLIDDDLPASSPIKEEISRIIEAVKRAAELTSKFQDFARNPKIEKPGEAGEDKKDGRK
jgi:PAS domain S-box-containing protein